MIFAAAALAIVFVAQLTPTLIISEAGIAYIVSQLVLICASCTFLALAFSLERRNWKLRFKLHTIFSIASFLIISLLKLFSGLPEWACCAIPLGTYFLIYYVLGVVQFPIRKAWRKEGLRVPFLPFFPLIPTRVFNRMTYAKNEEQAPIVRFSAGETKGLLIRFYLPEDGRKFLLYELSAPISEKDFFVLRAIVRKYGFLTLGYSVGWDGEYSTRVVLVPKLEKYAEGRRAVDRFFKRKRLRFVCSVDEYAERGFWEDVIQQVVPVHRDKCKLDAEEEFDEKEVLLLNQVQFALNEQPRIDTVSFCVTFSNKREAGEYLKAVKKSGRSKLTESALIEEVVTFAYEILEATDKTVVALVKKEWEAARDMGALNLVWGVGPYAA